MQSCLKQVGAAELMVLTQLRVLFILAAVLALLQQPASGQAGEAVRAMPACWPCRRPWRMAGTHGTCTWGAIMDFPPPWSLLVK